jgi:hypothetical protein
MIDVSIPPKRNFRIAHTAPTDLIAAEVDYGGNEGGVGAPSVAILIETGN